MNDKSMDAGWERRGGGVRGANMAHSCWRMMDDDSIESSGSLIQLSSLENVYGWNDG